MWDVPSVAVFSSRSVECFPDIASKYTICPESKCTDFPMDKLATWHLVDVYQRIGSDLGCMLNVVSTGSAQSVVLLVFVCGRVL